MLRLLDAMAWATLLVCVVGSFIAMAAWDTDGLTLSDLGAALGFGVIGGVVGFVAIKAIRAGAAAGVVGWGVMAEHKNDPPPVAEDGSSPAPARPAGEHWRP